MTKGVRFPTRLEAAAMRIHACIQASRDGLLRVECDPEIDFDALWEIVDPSKAYRFGILEPFEYSGGRRKGVTKDPRLITRWRNGSIAARREAPIVIFGRASGREEAGLRRVPTIVTEGDVIEMFRALGVGWLQDCVTDTDAPQRFFESLTRMAREFLVDANLLSAYCTHAFRDARLAHLQPQKELWRLGLIPDGRAQDSKTPGTRLSVNHSTAQFLRSVPDGGADENRMARLKQQAEEGNEIAAAALSYARTKDVRHLAQVDLDALLELMGHKKIPPKGPEATLDLFRALDQEGEQVSVLLVEIGKDFDPAGGEFEKSYEFGKQRVSVEFERHDPDVPFVSDSEEEQVLATLRKEGVPPEDADRITEVRLRTVSETVGRLLKSPEIPRLAEEYLTARRKVGPLDRWAEHVLEILLVKQEILEIADAYLRAWERLVSGVLQEAEVRHTRQLREWLTLLDAEWETSEDLGQIRYVRCRLAPIHPFVLAPLVALARYARSVVGKGNVGKQLLWARDRARPAYPAIWAPDSSLMIYEAGEARPVFGISPQGGRPSLSRGGGLEDVVQSYLRLHPYAHQSLSLLLIDPPLGHGIASTLRTVERAVNDLRVFVLRTGGESADLTGLPFVHELGVAENLGQWSKGASLRVHIVFCFRAGANEGVHSGRLQPSRGLHNVLTVSVDQPSILKGRVDERVPYVCLQPREANQVVRLFLELARSTRNEDKFFEVRPMLGPGEAGLFVSLASFTDWLVIGTPSPIGLIPPRKFSGDELVYVGRENLGPYSLFVYGRDLFSVRRRVMEEVRAAPLRPATRELEDQLQALAVTVPNGVLRIGRGEKTVTPLLGLMAAAYFAKPRGNSEYFTVTVSVDSLEWTRHWLGERRCDLLSIDIALTPDLQPQMRLTAVESKSRIGDEVVPLSRNHPVFRGALDQVIATLDALEETIAQETAGQSVVADLKLSALFEHLASEVLAQLVPIQATDLEKLHVLEVLSTFSRRELIPGAGLELRGLVVVTQRDAAVETEKMNVAIEGTNSRWRSGIIRCGIPALRGMLEDSGLTALVAAVLPDIPREEIDEERIEVVVEVEAGKGERIESMTKASEVSEVTKEMILQLETACRLRQFPIDPVNAALALEGPTLVTVPVALRAGASLKPIAAAAGDLARELGVRTVVVENDPARPYHVRFLLPRADRVSPVLPEAPPEVADEHYLPLWLGAEVDGRPYRSHVSEWPHLLVAGTTGSGKTTFLRSLLLQIDRLPDTHGKVVIVDGKAEFDYEGVVGRDRFVDQFREILLGHDQVVPVLQWVVNEEVARRREALRTYFASHQDAPRAPRQAYRAALDAGEQFPIVPLLVCVDEFAEIMLAAGTGAREFEDLVQRVVQAGRSALIHLILATQRPDANVLRGAIKANLPSRVALQLPSHHDSMTVLNSPGAEDLLGSGDLLFQSGTVDRVRLQGFMPSLKRPHG